MNEVRRHETPDGSFIIVFLGDGQTPHQLELTWLRDRKEPPDSFLLRGDFSYIKA
jgi:lactoylglutathione lyase